MKEIEKLYKLAGVKKITLFKPKHSIALGDYDEEYVDYPLFTAEKQVELIKWLSDTDYFVQNIYKTIDTKEFFIENCYYEMQADKFEEALAGLINKLWKDLTEEEKQQVKGMLE